MEKQGGLPSGGRIEPAALRRMSLSLYRRGPMLGQLLDRTETRDEVAERLDDACSIETSGAINRAPNDWWRTG